MNIARTKILGSTYVGLFGITNDKLCFLPSSVEDRALKTIEEVLDVKTVKTSIYDSPLLAVFGKMNNKQIFLPSFISGREIETIEKEIKVNVLKMEQALGNLVELNDTGAIVSELLTKKAVEEIKKSGLAVMQRNIAKTDVVGSCITITNNGFVVNPNVSMEEAKQIEATLKVKGGSATANTGDMFIRNSILANSKGFLVGENTTPHEINRIEDALIGKE